MTPPLALSDRDVQQDDHFEIAPVKDTSTFGVAERADEQS